MKMCHMRQACEVCSMSYRLICLLDTGFGKMKETPLNLLGKDDLQATKQLCIREKIIDY